LKQALRYAILLCTALLPVFLCTAQKTDTLAEVKLRSLKQLDITTAAIPVQQLNAQELQRINSVSVADAVKHFAGVIVKDYGGIGGLKTVSVRSLGANQTGVLYNGIMLGDAMGGQIDLGKFSLDNVDDLQLYNSGPSGTLQTARAYSSAAILSIKTNTILLNEGSSLLKAKMKGGSFGFINPALSYKTRVSRLFQTGLNAEYIQADGNYKYTSYDNSAVKVKRINTDIKSFVAEYNASFIINDSNRINVTAYYYDSRRGLPGAVILYNPASTQRLADRNFFTQAVWQNYISPKSRLLISAKFSKDKKYYLDPSYPNAAHMLENDFHQKEKYLSAAYSYKVLPALTLSLASDFINNTLKRTDQFAAGFAAPVRNTYLNNLAAQFKKENIEISGNLLYTYLKEEVKAGPSGKTINELTPALSVSVQPVKELPLRVRAFYKNIFRVPTFIDLYYTNIGNVNLRPEYAKQYDLGITYTAHTEGFLKEITATADGYINEIKDRILAVPRQNLFQWTMLNVGKVKIHGIDAGAYFAIKEFKQINVSSRMAYTFQQALDLSDAASPLYKKQLPYTPEHSGSVMVNADYKRISVSYNIVMSSYRYRLGEQIPENVVQGWAAHDLSLQYSLPERRNIAWKITGELNNIYNTQYEIIKYYPMPGMSYRIGITAQIKHQHKNKNNEQESK
jgi:outer membrane cobalamin receptor